MGAAFSFSNDIAAPDPIPGPEHTEGIALKPLSKNDFAGRI
jgi:hypothetical protein